MYSDLRYAFRQLAKSPGFSFIAILALGLGIGANTAIFSIVDSVFLRPLPYAEPSRIVRLSSTTVDGALKRVDVSYPRYEAIRDGQQVFSELAIGAFTNFTATGRGDPERLGGYRASANFLLLLGLQPALGRSFTADEDRPGGAPVAMLSHARWRDRFNSDAGVLGQTITLNGVPHTIVGVMPAALSRFPYQQVDVWAPRAKELPEVWPEQLNKGAFIFQVLARLKPEVTVRQAQENVAVIAAQYKAAHPANTDAPTIAEVTPLLDDLIGDQRRTYALLFGAVGCVLLIACANVANLLLARFVGRRKEIALRYALGATRLRVIRQLVLESTLVALCGGALGLLLAFWSLGALLRVGEEIIPRSLDVGLSPVALGFTVLVALVTGVVMGLLPAIQAARHDVNDALKDASRGSSSSRGQKQLRSSLLVGEIALSVVLVIAASLLLTSFVRLQKASPGFNPTNLFVGFLDLPATRYPDLARLATIHRQLYQRLATIPGAQSVALHGRPPMIGIQGDAPVAPVGDAIPPLSERAFAHKNLVSPNVFATLGIPLKAGRDFNERDTPESAPVVIISEALAKRHFAGKDPIGRVLITGMGERRAEVVGVVGDIRSVNLGAGPQQDYYLPVLQRPEKFIGIVIRAAGDAGALTGAVRAALREVDPNLPLIDPAAMQTLVAKSVADRRLAMFLLTGFAGLALLLASIGVYSVMAYVVTQRTTEIGIRMALGASQSSVQRMIVREGMRLAATGVGIGLLVAVGVTRLMQQALFGVEASDPLIYVGIAALISAVAAMACWLPARRAARTDPMIALRAP